MRLDFCVLCGSKDDIEQHHIIPKSSGGSDDSDNILSLCFYHHRIIHERKEGVPVANLIRKGLKRKSIANKKNGVVTLKGDGKCAGRKSLRELDPELVKAARKQLKWSARSGKKKPTLRQAAQGLFELGYMTSTGKPFSAAQVQRIAGK